MVPPLAPANSMTVVAEDDSRLVGFVQVVFDDDHRCGSLIDNLHITPHRRRSGIGTALLTCAAEADTERATGKSTYLSVLEQNTVAQLFYRTFGGTRIESAEFICPNPRHGSLGLWRASALARRARTQGEEAISLTDLTEMILVRIP